MSKRLALPTEMPDWYRVKPIGDETEEYKYKGWTPETGDIVEKSNNYEVVNAWNGSCSPQPAKLHTVKLSGLKVISPIQVGGDSFFEGGTLPAQVNGVPWIPGSSVKGALLSWLRKQWSSLDQQQQGFWSRLMSPDRQAWLPRKIRFESVLLKNLKPFPLNPQQEWQIFDERSRETGGTVASTS